MPVDIKVFLLHQADGLITGVYQTSETAPPTSLIPGQQVGPAVDLDQPVCLRPNDFCILGGLVVERATISATVSAATIPADGIAECVIAGLPDPCRVTIIGAVSAAPAEVNGGTLTLTSTQPGAITIRVTADPTHKPWETVIHAA
jgi:hypothetical protein